jgi:hypothetical protein
MKPILHIAAVGGGIAFAATVFLLLARRPRTLPFKVVIDNTGLPTKKAAHFTMKMAAFQRQMASVRSLFRS